MVKYAMAIRERDILNSEFPARRPLSSVEYFDLARLGYFDGEHVELIDGEILTMAPVGDLHRSIIDILASSLRKMLNTGFFVSVQSPYVAGSSFVPEPDLVVIQGSARDYLGKPLPTASLVIEVSESSLQFDRSIKGPIYARSGVLEYWIVNLVETKLEVYRQPSESGYFQSLEFVKGQTVFAICQPDLPIAVADLLP